MKAIFMLMMVLASPAFGQTATTTATSTPPYAAVQKPPLTYEISPELADLRQKQEVPHEQEVESVYELISRSHDPFSPDYAKAALAYERERRDGEEAARASGRAPRPTNAQREAMALETERKFQEARKKQLARKKALAEKAKRAQEEANARWAKEAKEAQAEWDAKWGEKTKPTRKKAPARKSKTTAKTNVCNEIYRIWKQAEGLYQHLERSGSPVLSAEPAHTWGQLSKAISKCTRHYNTLITIPPFSNAESSDSYLIHRIVIAFHF